MRIIILAVLMSTSAAAAAAEITGPGRVVDGDTVIVGDTRVRLKGVDAAERGTDLGEAARIVMMTIVDGGPLTCRLTGEKTWRREVGYCARAEGVDINREIIEQGPRWPAPGTTHATFSSSRPTPSPFRHGLRTA